MVEVICLIIWGSLATVIATIVTIMYLRKKQEEVYSPDESVAAERVIESSGVVGWMVFIVFF